MRLSPLQPPPQCHSPLTTHRSPLTTHHAPLTTHRSLIILHLSGLLPRDVEAQVVDARLRWDVQVTAAPPSPTLRAPHSEPHTLHILTPHSHNSDTPSLPRTSRTSARRSRSARRSVRRRRRRGGGRRLLQSGLPSRTMNHAPLATHRSPLTSRSPSPFTASPLRWAPASCRSASGTRRTSRAPSASAASGRR